MEDLINAWAARGRMIETRDGRVFVVDTGGAGAGGEGAGAATPVLVLHGFPTSSFDFRAALPHLGLRRVVLFDFLGYGLSDKPVDFGYSLFEQADLAQAVARACGLTRVHLWAHDVGTSVATELLARRERGQLPLAIESVTLMNGSVHIELSRLTPSQRLLRTPLGPLFARLSGRALFKLQLRRVFAVQPPEAELDALWELICRQDGRARLPALIGYVSERARFARRWIGALERLDLPAHVAWGLRDPVAVPAIADRLAAEIPGARRTSWADLGHYPQLEDPRRVAEAVAGFWETIAA